ncbi:MAG TPA: YceH family protein [Casimicrobiaceae bacterium]
MKLPPLSLLETRVLGVLVEKQHTVADTYPLTLNALVAGCNQKTSRDPVLNATDGEVQMAIDHLRSLSLIVESSGGRVMRYAHNVERVLSLPSQSVALLAALMLRGAQTVAELRTSSERLHRFADVSAVEGFLHELAARSEGALVEELPKAAGERENRWVHLLSGRDAALAALAAVPASGAATDTLALSELAAVKASIVEMRAEIERLSASIARLRAELGALPDR